MHDQFTMPAASAGVSANYWEERNAMLSQELEAAQLMAARMAAVRPSPQPTTSPDWFLVKSERDPVINAAFQHRTDADSYCAARRESGSPDAIVRPLFLRPEVAGRLLDPVMVAGIWHNLGGPDRWLLDFGFQQFAEAVGRASAGAWGVTIIEGGAR